MKRRGVLVALLLCPLALLLGWLLWVWGSGDLGYRPLSPGSDAGPDRAGYAWYGAVHVHSRLSGDASGTIEEIVAAAEAADLDFVVLTEHTRAEGSRGRHRPGWYGDVLVVAGEEISTSGGHLLALDVPAHPYALGPTPEQAYRDLEALGARAVIAHPVGGESAWEASWSPAAGAEVVSLYSALLRASEAGLLRALLAYPVNPMAATARLLRAPSGAIDAWDTRTRLDAEPFPRRLAAVGSVDAHGPGALGFPDYVTAFRTLQMKVWMPDPPTPAEGGDRVSSTRLAEAITAGRSAVVISALGARPAVSFHARGADGSIVSPGGVAPWESRPWTLEASLPAAGPWEARLLLDGRPVATGSEPRLTHAVERPGTYRLEVVRTDLGTPTPGAPPWIFSNPVYVWPSLAAIAAQVHPVPPLPAPPVDLDLLVVSGWAPRHERGAYSAMAIPSAGLEWTLRLAPSGPADRYAALTWRPGDTVDWRDYGGLAVRLRSDEVWRVALRVWTREDDGRQLTWERVVPTGPEGPSIGTRWSEFRLLEEAAAGSGLGARLDRVEGAALVVTPHRMRAGTEARIDVRTFGLFAR